MFRGFTMAAAGLLLCAGGYARADGDLIRLGGKGDDAGVTTTLGLSGDVDTHLTRYFRGGYSYGGYRGFAGYGYGFRGYGYGYRGFGYGGYYGGYRGFYGGYRPYYGGYGYGYARSYYYPYSYYGSYYPYYGGYYGGYGGYYGGYGGYYPYYSSYYYPCVVTPSVTVNAAPYYNYNGANYQQAQPFMPPADGKNGQTYPYDGGPASPLPKADENAPIKEPIPQPKVPREGRIAAQPLQSPYSFAAYGQPANQAKVVNVVIGTPKPLPSPYAATTAKVERPAATTATATKIAYPAYGEQPLVPAVRVQLTQNR
jgi:hypothetical protein